MRYCFFAAAILFFCFSATAQTNKIIKHYDSAWMTVPAENAVYYTEFEKVNKYYSCTSYYAASKKLKSIATATDTFFTKQIGLLKGYYETGVLEDSILVSADGNETETFHYYPSGKLWCYDSYQKKANVHSSQGFDEAENEIPGFVTIREAVYIDGAKEWEAYLAKKVNVRVPSFHNAPKGVYTVVVRFVVDTEGKIINVKPETNLGYGMEEELIRVIKKSKDWIPAIKYNKPVKAYRRQPLTFVLS